MADEATQQRKDRLRRLVTGESSEERKIRLKQQIQLQGIDVTRSLPPGNIPEQPVQPQQQQGPIVQFPPDAIHANSPAFQQMLGKAQSGGLDALSDEEKKRVQAAGNAYPEQMGEFLREVVSREGTTESSADAQSNVHADLQPIAQAIGKIGDAIGLGGVDPKFNPMLGAAILETGIRAKDIFKDASGEFFGNVIGFQARTGKTIGESVSENLDNVGLAPLEKDDPRAVRKELDNDGNFVERKMTEGERIASNFAMGAVRFLPELITAAGEDPGGFQVALAEFPFQEASVILEATTGQSVTIEDGQIVHRHSSDKEVEEAVEELKQQPFAVALLGLMVTGAARKGAKSRRVSVEKAKIEKLQIDAEKAQSQAVEQQTKVADGEARIKSAEESAKVFEEFFETVEKELADVDIIRKSREGAEGLKSELTEAQAQSSFDKFHAAKDKAVRLRDRRANEIVRGRKEGRKPVVPETADPAIPRIEALKPGELRSEALSLQGKDGFSASDIAKMTDKEAQFIVSGGRIGIEPGTIKAKEAPSGVQERPTEKGPEKQPEVQKPAPKSEKEAPAKPEAVKTEIREDGRPRPEVQKDLDRAATELEQAKKTVSELAEAEAGLIEAGAKANDPQLTAVRSFRASEQKRLSDLEIERGSLSEEIKTAPEAKIGFEEAEKRQEPAKAPEISPEAIAEDLGVIFKGEMELTKGRKAYRFQDPTNGGDFSVKDLSKVEAELKKLRANPPAQPPAVEPAPKPADTKIDTGFEGADIARNLAHAKSAVGVAEQAIGLKEITSEQRGKAQADLVTAKKKVTDLEVEFDRFRDQAETKVEAAVEVPVETTTKLKDADIADTGLKTIAAKDIVLDEARFQGRKLDTAEKQAKFDERVDAIVSEFDPGEARITVWKDPKTGKHVLLQGHHTLAAINKLGRGEANVRVFKGTEAEALAEARIKGNRRTQSETITEDVDAYRLAKEQGMERPELERIFGKDRVNKLESLSSLDPNGKFMLSVEEAALGEHPHISRWTRNVGDLRKKLPELTNAHEKQIFDQLYPADKATGLFDKLTKDDLFNIVEKQVTDFAFTPNLPIKLKRDFRPQTGDRASPNKAIQQAVAKIDRLDELIKDKNISVEETQRLQGERTTLQQEIRGAVNQQTGFELGAFGTPKDLINLYETAYSGIKGISEFADQTIKNAKLPPEVKAGQQKALDQMTQHRKNELEAKTQRLLASNELKKIIPDETRWEPIIHAWEQGPGSRHWTGLSSLEKGVATWLREESIKWEKFAVENGLIEKPVGRPAGQVHVFHHWKNPKTGKATPAEFGRLAKTAPTLLKRTHQTVEAGQTAGLDLATTNPGTLLGHSIVNLMKSHGSRELYKNLNNVVYSDNFTIKDKGKERPLMMIENWKQLEKQGLTEGYEWKSDPFLDRPVRYKDAQGNVRIIEGAVGVREEIATHWDAYRENPSTSKLEKLLNASKSIVLSGFFHPVQLGMQQLARGRVPFTGIRKGLKLLKNPDEVTQGLIRNGLDNEGFRDFEVNPSETLKIASDKPLAKAANVALAIPRGIAKLTFDVIHPGMKTTHAYDTFNRIWPDYERQGLSKEAAYRDAVKMSDDLFSGQDYKLALLESSKASVQYWYSASARRFWRNSLLSPTWQSSHVAAFTSTTKSVVPNNIRNRFGFEDQTPIAKEYRKYLAGAVTLYSAANMMNWVNTKDMDGEGRFMFQNPEGKAFRVRARWNNPDGSVAWVSPFKSIFEVPEAIGALATGEFGKFTNKLAPIIGEGIEFFYNLDDFGNPQEDKGVPERLKDFGLGVTTPILVSQIFDYMDNNKAPIGIALSAFGFPVSKGAPAGLTVGREESSKMLSDFKHDLRKTDKENMKLVTQDLIDGNVTEALVRMSQMGKGSQAMANALLRQRDRLLSNWNNTTDLQKVMFLNAVGPEEAQKFLDELTKTP